MTQIIGIAGVMGAGKTTLSESLGKQLDATVLHWDEYDEISEAPDDMIEWYHESKDYDEWKYPALADTLETLKAGRSLVCPATERIIKPTQFVVFDAPLGRRHFETGRFIDYLIWIELPLDVSLTRWLLRNYQNKSEAEASHILDELEFHLNQSRSLFIDNEDIIEGADLTVDGTLPVDQITVQAVTRLLGFNGPNL